MSTTLSRAVLATAVFGASVHVGWEAARPPCPIYVILVTTALALGGWATVLPVQASSILPIQWRSPLYLFLVGTIAYLLDVFDTFAAAYVCVQLVLLPLQVSQSRGLLRYDATSAWYVTDAGATYALLRVVGATVVRHTALPARLALLLPAVIALGETSVMYAGWGLSRFYSFGADTVEFAAYAVLKTALFLMTPLVDDWLVTSRPQWVDECVVRVPTHESCVEVYDPVCGCNDVTYSNECVANRSVSLWTHGGCS